VPSELVASHRSRRGGDLEQPAAAPDVDEIRQCAAGEQLDEASGERFDRLSSTVGVALMVMG
jgi:hypothetical protein